MTDTNTEFRLPYSYCGLLDDVVADYDPTYNSPDLFNRILVKSLVFGGGLYINDGYLFMHSAARAQMKDPDSVLCKMLEYGFVKIFTRKDTLDGLKNLVDDSDIPSHIKFRSTAEWKELQPRWYSICEEAWRHVTAWGNPRNHKIQSKLYERVLVSPPPDLGLSCSADLLERIQQLLFTSPSDSAEDLNPYTGAARTKYENACKIALNESNVPREQKEQMMRELMRLANETYHYAFGASLSFQHGTTAVDTAMSPAFDELIRRPNIEYRKFETVPAFGIPVDVDLSLGDKLVPLMDKSHEAFKAKTLFVKNFIDHLQVENTKVSDWEHDVRETADLYARALNSLLDGVDMGQILDESADHQVALARSKMGYFDAAATPLPGVSATIVQKDGKVIGDCVAKYTIPDEDKFSSWKFTGQEIIPQVSSLAFSESVVSEILDDEFMLNDDLVRKTQ